MKIGKKLVNGYGYFFMKPTKWWKFYSVVISLKARINFLQDFLVCVTVQYEL